MQKTIYIPDNEETRKVMERVTEVSKAYAISFSELCYIALKAIATANNKKKLDMFVKRREEIMKDVV